LHAHQAPHTSQENGEEGHEEASYRLDRFLFLGSGSGKDEEGRVSGAIRRGHLPSTEVIPLPQPGFWVMFLAFLLRGFSLPAHEFLCGLLFVYGMQLHQLTPNSMLHIACFITLCEAFLGINPHWGLWKFLFHLCPNASKEEVHDLGGAIVSVRSESQYLAFEMAEFVQG
jgi:hypothetical protein